MPRVLTISVLVLVLGLLPNAGVAATRKSGRSYCPSLVLTQIGKLRDLPFHLNNPAFLPYTYLKILNHLTGFSNEVVVRPLSQLKALHPIDYPSAWASEKLAKRVVALRERRTEILSLPVLSFQAQHELMPSDQELYGHADADGRVAIYNGNGRLEALRQAFGRDSNLPIELHLSNLGLPQVLSLLESIRRKQGLTD